MRNKNGMCKSDSPLPRPGSFIAAVDAITIDKARDCPYGYRGYGELANQSERDSLGGTTDATETMSRRRSGSNISTSIRCNLGYLS